MNLNATPVANDVTQYQRIIESLTARQETLTEPVKLPPEEQLAREYNIARNTLRRAMQVLEHRGAVTRRRGRGTFLMPKRPALSTQIDGQTIGLVMPWWTKSIHEWYVASVVDGITQATDKSGCQLSFLRADRLDSDEHKFLKHIATRKIAGLLWVHPVPTQEDLLCAVARHLPSVIVGREYQRDNLCSITPDYGQAAALIDKYLVNRGHHEYVVMSKNVIDPFGQSWFDGFDKAVRQRGEHFDYQRTFLDASPFKAGYGTAALLKLYLQCHPEMTTCVLTSSSHLVELLADKEIRQWIPERLSLVAFDYGVQAMNTYWPGHAITHVRCDWGQIGRRAVDLLSYQLTDVASPSVSHEEVTLEEGITVVDLGKSGGAEKRAP